MELPSKHVPSAEYGVNLGNKGSSAGSLRKRGIDLVKNIAADKKVKSVSSGVKTFDLWRHMRDEYVGSNYPALVSGTKFGGILSITCTIAIFLLVMQEFVAYRSIYTTSAVKVNSEQDAKFRINFNVTMLRLPCEFAHIEVYDVFGTKRKYSDKSIVKWKVSRDGKESHGRAQEIDFMQGDGSFEGGGLDAPDSSNTHSYASDLDMENTNMHAAHSIELSDRSFDHVVKSSEFTLVNFYAPWCSHCKRFHPTWETMAYKAASKPWAKKVSFGSVDCDSIHTKTLCTKAHIRGYPTVLTYVGGNPEEHHSYHGSRTVEAIFAFIESELQLRLKSKAEKEKEEKKKREIAKSLDEHVKEENLKAEERRKQPSFKLKVLGVGESSNKHNANVHQVQGQAKEERDKEIKSAVKALKDVADSRMSKKTKAKASAGVVSGIDSKIMKEKSAKNDATAHTANSDNIKSADMHKSGMPPAPPPMAASERPERRLSNIFKKANKRVGKAPLPPNTPPAANVGKDTKAPLPPATPPVANAGEDAKVPLPPATPSAETVKEDFKAPLPPDATTTVKPGDAASGDDTASLPSKSVEGGSAEGSFASLLGKMKKKGESEDRAAKDDAVKSDNTPPEGGSGEEDKGKEAILKRVKTKIASMPKKKRRHISSLFHGTRKDGVSEAERKAALDKRDEAEHAKEDALRDGTLGDEYDNEAEHGAHKNDDDKDRGDRVLDDSNDEHEDGDDKNDNDEDEEKPEFTDEEEKAFEAAASIHTKSFMAAASLHERKIVLDEIFEDVAEVQAYTFEMLEAAGFDLDKMVGLFGDESGEDGKAGHGKFFEGDGGKHYGVGMSCTKWRQTGKCDPEGPHEPNADKNCDVVIMDGNSGYCECENNRKVHKVGCSHKPFTCEDACVVPVIHRRPHGCILSGSIEMQKVPGSLHIVAYSKRHDIPPEIIDTSHRVNHFRYVFLVPLHLYAACSMNSCV